MLGVLAAINKSKLHDCERKGEGNYWNFDKTQVKLFPNFTRHHLITHTYSAPNRFKLMIKEAVRIAGENPIELVSSLKGHSHAVLVHFKNQ